MAVTPREFRWDVDAGYHPFEQWFFDISNMARDFELDELAEVWFEMDRAFLTGETLGNTYVSAKKNDDTVIMFGLDSDDL